MTVSTELSHEEYTGNGVTTDFDFRFRIFEAKHLVVSVADQDGTERILTNGTDYTLRGVGSYRGGKVILKMPLATGWKIGIACDLPAVQETDLRNQGKFFAEVHEDAFDYLTMLIQKSLGYVSLCLRKPSFISDHYDAKGNKISNIGKPVKDGDAVDLGTMKEHISAKDKRSLRVADKDIPALPNAANRANKLLSFDNHGDPVVIVPESGSAADVLAELGKPGGASLIGYGEGTLVDKLTELVSVRDFGAKGDGVTDDTAAIKGAMDFVSGKGGGVVYIPSGTYLLNTVTSKIYATDYSEGNWVTDKYGIRRPLAGMNSWSFFDSRNNITIIGDGPSSVLKSADGLVKLNSDYAGTKGVQFFTPENWDSEVVNFKICNLCIDHNGYNNKVAPLNWTNNQAGAQAVAIDYGDNIIIDSVLFKDAPGYQVIMLSHGVKNSTISNNKFTNCGWLRGENKNLTDHSSIYIAGNDYSVLSNSIYQDEIGDVGAAIECHGRGVISGNRIKNYAGIINIGTDISGNTDVLMSNNTADGCGGGVGLYAVSQRSVKVKMMGNSLALNGRPPANFHLVGDFKQMIAATKDTISADGVSNVEIYAYNNTFKMETGTNWDGDDFLKGAFAILSQVKVADFNGNTIDGFKGALINLHPQMTGAIISFRNNNVIGCGTMVSSEYKYNTGFFSYTNGGRNDYGNVPSVFEILNNSFHGCSYGCVINSNNTVLGRSLMPSQVTMKGNVYSNYETLLYAASPIDNDNVRINIDDSFSGYISTNDKIVSNQTTVLASLDGKFTSLDGEFYSSYNISQVNYNGKLLEPVPPSSPRALGDKRGDVYDVINTSLGLPYKFVCVASGVNGATGTWKGIAL